jgi:RNA polymerase sigma-70 factor, ECF subfamily
LFKIFKKDKSHYTDSELVEQYRKTLDQKVLAILFTRYTHMAFGVCMKYLQQSDDASDAVMNIYEKLEKEITRHEIQNFATWLYVITKNHCLMELRSRKSKEKQHDKWMESELIFMELHHDLHPLDEDHGLQTQKLKDCIEKLKTDQRKCIEMFYYHNKCYEEIALSLKLEEKSVKSHLQNGKRNLKICLETSHEKEKAT